VNNQLLSDGVYNYTYDGEGNRTRRVEISTGKVTEYVWDYRNRLASVLFKDAGGVVTKTIEYLYDGNNQRIGKRIDGAVVERYVIDRNQIALVFDGAGVQTHRYLYGTQIDQVLADETLALTNWFLADNQGTVRDVVDSNGTVIDHINYDSFGKVQSQSNAGYDLRFGYTGREQDGETGLDYYRARYYDSANGRFISEDPLGFDAGDSNLSRYVGNSSTNAVDPDGNRGLPPVRVVPRNPPRNFPGTGTQRQPGINPYRQNVPGYTNYPSNNSTPPERYVPSCVTVPGGTCNPQQFDPNAQLRQIQELISPTTCAANEQKEINVTLWRGVPKDHPKYSFAQKGIAQPFGGHSDPDNHNLGDTYSVFTSWTLRKNEAKRFATRNNIIDGIILEKEFTIPDKRLYVSPDSFGEQEILVRGSVFGAKVIYVKRSQP
jgi:RHS repeat-associated protein